MRMPESVKSTTREAKFIEDRRQYLLYNVFRGQEAATCVQEKPLAFERRDVFANESYQSIGQRQDRLAG